MNRRDGIQLCALVLILTIISGAFRDDDPAGKPAADSGGALFKEVAASLVARAGEFDDIDLPRREKLDELSGFIRQQLAAHKTPRLLFVCTHNSRRSQMAQIWAAVAAEKYGLTIATYSGGTEASAFNSRAVAAMERAGLRIEKSTDDSNAIYHVRFSAIRPALTCFSKRFDNPPNPREEFAAVMVCSDADRACPIVPGSSARIAIPYVDPKESDGTGREAAVYDERCAQIEREMLYVMSRVNGAKTNEVLR